MYCRRRLWTKRWECVAVTCSLYLSFFVVFLVYQKVNVRPPHVRYNDQNKVQPKNNSPFKPFVPVVHKTWREPFVIPDFKFSRDDLRIEFKKVLPVNASSAFYDNAQDIPCKQTHDELNINVTEDLFCLPRPKYQSDYKNPCFSVSPNRMRPFGGVTCLPYFHILGADKCGTTDFHSRLSEHPRILLNNGGLGKETYYWCWLRHGLWMKGETWRRTFEKYHFLFYKPSIRIFMELKRSHQQFITGDGTPMDLWDFRGWQREPQNYGLEEPVVLTPHVMRHIYKYPRFFVLMRNPVERLFSDYVFLGYGFTPEKFAEDVPKAIAMMRDCLAVNSTRSCFFSDELYHKMPMRLHISCYSIFLREWLSVFHPNHFMFIRTEDYHANTVDTLEKAFKFLDIDALSMEELRIIASAKIKHETVLKKKIGDMYPETRALLVEFYRRFNEDLAELLGDVRFLWNDP